MGNVIAFENTDDSWLYTRGMFEVLLYEAVFRHADRNKLSKMFPVVEHEISDFLPHVEPENYPGPGGSLGYLSFTDFPREEREELLRAMKLGVEAIRSAEPSTGNYWYIRRTESFVRTGEELIEMMERSLEAPDAAVETE